MLMWLLCDFPQSPSVMASSVDSVTNPRLGSGAWPLDAFAAVSSALVAAIGERAS